jgi:hypothetical protein
VLTESAKKLRDPLALGLLGVTALYLIASMSVLFNGDLGDFSQRAAGTQHLFVSPVWVIVTVAAALLVAAVAEPTPMARIVVPAALGVQGVMLLLGLITWFAGYGLDTGGGGGGNLPEGIEVPQVAAIELAFGGVQGAGKIVGTFLMLAYIGLLAIGAYLTFTLFQGLPAPVRQHQQQQWGQQQWGGQQQWAGQPQQQQWGGQPQQQWGGQPQHQQQQWGAAAGGAAAGGAAATQAWGQPTSGESSTGYAAGGDTGQPVAGSGESSTGYAAGGDAGQQAQPPQWGQQPPADPAQQQQQWGQPQPEAPQQGEGQQQEGEDDRPGWWSPSS